MKPFYNFDIEQRSPEWYEAKLGKFSGSDFHVMLGNSDAKTNFLWNKISELRYQDTEQDEYTSYAMERGIILEPEARRVYSAVSEADVREVGLVEARDEFDGWAVCSPDGLVGEDGIIEIKVIMGKFFEQYTRKGEKKYGYIKPEYRTQVQFNLFVTQRDWCDFIYYHPRGGIFIHRVFPDAEYIEKIKTALREGIQFIKERI